ncbi:MAG: 2-C-methyl-D-erythritol 2,4-cyclodiphosphate synthase [Fusobacteriaceae bacterium]
MFRIGNGYDVHRLVEGRKLILGGVEIPHTKGVLGHSDGDVLIHAIMDGILGALALGDIGQHFPDTDLKYEGIDSMLLLKRVVELMEENGYGIVNLDSIIVLQKPKVKPHIESMRERIAHALKTELGNISVKATTEEKLGFTGDESGVKSYCTVLLKKVS